MAGKEELHGEERSEGEADCEIDPSDGGGILSVEVECDGDEDGNACERGEERSSAGEIVMGREENFSPGIDLGGGVSQDGSAGEGQPAEACWRAREPGEPPEAACDSEQPQTDDHEGSGIVVRAELNDEEMGCQVQECGDIEVSERL